MNEGPSCIFRSKRKCPLSGCCNQFCLFSQVLAFLWWSRGGGGLLVRGRFFRKSVQKRSARMGLIRLQRGPGWEREWVWTTFLTSVAPVHPPAGNGSEYQNFSVLLGDLFVFVIHGSYFKSNFIYIVHSLKYAKRFPGLGYVPNMTWHGF